MNKTKIFLLKIKQHYNVVFKKLENITEDNKMRILRMLYFLLVPLLLCWVISIEPWEILDEPCFQSEKLLLMEAVFMGIVCFFFRLSIQRSFVFSAIVLMMSFLFTKFLGDKIVMSILDLFSINEVYRFLVYSFATGVIFLLFGEVFLRMMRKTNLNNCNLEKKN